VERGIRFGERVAVAVLAARADDGAAAAPPGFTHGAGPGQYQLTPPSFAPAAFTQTAQVTPFVLVTASRLRPAPPPALTSPKYAADFGEVHALGARNSPTRTAEETAIGRFWGAAPIWIVWNQIADQAATGLGNSLAQNARLFAGLDTTLADTAIALYDAKYAYHRWRPITAITAPEEGNPNTTPDPHWVPLATTANDPSYPGAHATFSQAAATVLEHFFGTDRFAFSLTNPSLGITRAFISFSQAAGEASASRIFAGQHFRYDERGRTDPKQPGGRPRDRPRPAAHRSPRPVGGERAAAPDASSATDAPSSAALSTRLPGPPPRPTPARVTPGAPAVGAADQLAPGIVAALDPHDPRLPLRNRIR
jgi:hypothetical protein